MPHQDQTFLQLAIKKAEESVARGGFPAGAVVAKNGKVIGEGLSIGHSLNDPTGHADMAAVRDACKNLRVSDLSDTVLYTSMQPCLMCLGAAAWGSVPKIVFACAQEKVSPAYYLGKVDVSTINARLTRPIELVHDVKLENESLAVVRTWEKANA